MFAWVRKSKTESSLYSFREFVERNFLISRLDFSVTVINLKNGKSQEPSEETTL